MKKARDVDSVAVTLYWRVLFTVAWPLVSIILAYLLACMIFRVPIHMPLSIVLIVIFVLFLAPFPIIFFINLTGNMTVGIYNGRKPNWSLEEQLESDMSITRNLKIKKDYPEALERINRVLEKHPKYSEALFLKAQILWEGFDNHVGAKVCLKKIMNLPPPKNENICRWASSLYEDITLHRRIGIGEE